MGNHTGKQWHCTYNNTNYPNLAQSLHKNDPTDHYGCCFDGGTQEEIANKTYEFSGGYMGLLTDAAKDAAPHIGRGSPSISELEPGPTGTLGTSGSTQCNGQPVRDETIGTNAGNNLILGMYKVAGCGHGQQCWTCPPNLDPYYPRDIGLSTNATIHAQKVKGSDFAEKNQYKKENCGKIYTEICANPENWFKPFGRQG